MGLSGLGPGQVLTGTSEGRPFSSKHFCMGGLGVFGASPYQTTILSSPGNLLLSEQSGSGLERGGGHGGGSKLA